MGIIYKLIRYIFRLIVAIARIIILFTLTLFVFDKVTTSIPSKVKNSKKPNKNILIGIAEHPHDEDPNYIPGGDSSVHNDLIRVLKESGYRVKIITYNPRSIRGNKFMIWLIGMPYLYSTYLKQISSQFEIIICDSGVVWDLRGNTYINLFHFSYIEYTKNVSKYYDPLSIINGLINGIIQIKGSKYTFNVAVSEYLRDKLKNVGIFIDVTISNGIDSDIFKPLIKRKKDSKILYLGGYSYFGKGFDIIRVLGKLGNKITCITNHFEKHWDNIEFLPPVSHELTPKTYTKYQITVYPSRFESCQMVPLESMACGTPVVISNVGIGQELVKVIPEFVVAGYDSRSIGEYNDRIKLILGNYEHYSKLARKYVVSNFNLIAFEKNWLTIVRKVYENTL